MMGQQQSTNENACRLSQNHPHLRIENYTKNFVGNTGVSRTSSTIAPHVSSTLHPTTQPFQEDLPLSSSENEDMRRYLDEQGRSSGFRLGTKNLAVSDSSGGNCSRQSVIFQYEKSNGSNVTHPTHRRTLSSPSSTTIHSLEASPLKNDRLLESMSGQHLKSLRNYQSAQNYDRETLSKSGVGRLSYFKSDSQETASHVPESQRSLFAGNNSAMQPQRTDTPNDLDYRQIGAFKLGSLRITNGTDSPVSSRGRVHESENGPQTNEKNTQLNSISNDKPLLTNNLLNMSSSSFGKNYELGTLSSDGDSLFHLGCYFKDFNVKDFDFNGQLPARKTNASRSSICDDSHSISSTSPNSLLCSPKLPTPAKKSRTSSKLSLVMNDRLFKEEPGTSTMNQNSTSPMTEIVSSKPLSLDEACIEIAKPLVKVDSGYMSNVSFPRTPPNEFSQALEVECAQSKSPMSDSLSFVSSICMPEKLMRTSSDGHDGRREDSQRENISRLERQPILTTNENGNNLSAGFKTSIENKLNFLDLPNENLSMRTKDLNDPGILSLPSTAPATRLHSMAHDSSHRSNPTKLTDDTTLSSHPRGPPHHSPPPLYVDREEVKCLETLSLLPSEEKLSIVSKLCEGGPKNVEAKRAFYNSRRPAALKIHAFNLDKVSRPHQKTQQPPSMNINLNASRESLKISRFISSPLESSPDQRKTHVVEKIEENLGKVMSPDDRIMSERTLSKYHIITSGSKTGRSDSNSPKIHGAQPCSRLRVGSPKKCGGYSSKRSAISRLPSGRQSLTSAQSREKRSSQPIPCRNRRSNSRMSLPSDIKFSGKEVSCFTIFSRPEHRQKNVKKTVENMAPLLEDIPPAVTENLSIVPFTSINLNKSILEEGKQQNTINWVFSQDKDTHFGEKYCPPLISSISSASLQVEDCAKSSKNQLLVSQLKPLIETKNTFEETIQRDPPALSENKDLSNFKAMSKAEILCIDESTSGEISESQTQVVESDTSIKFLSEEKEPKIEIDHSFRRVKDEGDHSKLLQDSYETDQNSEQFETAIVEAMVTSPPESSHEIKNRRISSSITKLLSSSKPTIRASNFIEPDRINSNEEKRHNTSKVILSDETTNPVSNPRPDPQRQNWRVRSSNDISRPVSPEILKNETDKIPKSNTKSKTAKHGVRYSCTELRPDANRNIISNTSRNVRSYPPQTHVTRRSSSILAKSSPSIKAPNFYAMIENAQKQIPLNHGPNYAYPLPSSSAVTFPEKTSTCPVTPGKKINKNDDLDQEKGSYANKILTFHKKLCPISDHGSGKVLYSRRSYENSLKSVDRNAVANKPPMFYDCVSSTAEDKTFVQNVTKTLPRSKEQTASDFIIEEDISNKKKALRNKSPGAQHIESVSSSILSRGRPVSRAVEVAKLTETLLTPRFKPKTDAERDPEAQDIKVNDKGCEDHEIESMNLNSRHNSLLNISDVEKSACSRLALDTPNSEIRPELNPNSSSKHHSSLDSLPSQILFKSRVSASNLSLSNSRNCSIARSSARYSTSQLKTTKDDKFFDDKSSDENGNKLKTRQSFDKPHTPEILLPLIPKKTNDRPPVSNIHISHISRSPVRDSDPVQHKIDELLEKDKTEKSNLGDTAGKEEQFGPTNTGVRCDSLASNFEKPKQADIVDIINQASQNPDVDIRNHNSNATRSSTNSRHGAWLNKSENIERRQSTGLYNPHQTSKRENSNVYGSIPRANNFPTIPKSIDSFYQGLHQPSLDMYYPVHSFETDTWSKSNPIRVIETPYNKRNHKANNCYGDEKELVILNSGWRKRDVLSGNEKTNEIYSTCPDSLDNWTEKALEIHVQEIWKGTGRLDFWQ